MKPILLVEDTSVLSKLMTMQFIKNGIPYELATHGGEAIELFSPGKYSLILLDCHMPVMDGYELTRSIRENANQTSARHIPIIGWTANALPEEAILKLSKK